MRRRRKHRRLRDVAVFSVCSADTDASTDAVGGFLTGETRAALNVQGLLIFDVLRDNDAYHTPAVCDRLICTGATGTNVNDVALLLIRR
jgi:glycerate 2-kinase